MRTEEDSYQEYKKYLEESLGISNIKAPLKPMNPYMRFFFERSCQERSKSNSNWKQITRLLAEEWKKLAQTKRQYYEKVYEIKLAERNRLNDEYQRLTKKKKPLAPYGRYVKKRYAQYQKQYPSYTNKDINKLVQNDWKNLSDKDKGKLQEQYQQEKQDLELNVDNSDRIAEYNQNLKQYHEELNEEKEKIMKKYGISKLSRFREKKLEREKERQKRRAQKQLERDQRKRIVAQQKKKARQARLKKQRQEKEEQRRAKQQERLKQRQKLQKEKAKAIQEQKQKKATALKQKVALQKKNKKNAPKSKTPVVKVETKQSKKESKERSQSKGKKLLATVAVKKEENVSKSSKSKKIKKPVKLAQKVKSSQHKTKLQSKSSAKKAPTKVTVKPKVASKGKGKAKGKKGK